LYFYFSKDVVIVFSLDLERDVLYFYLEQISIVKQKIMDIICNI